MPRTILSDWEKRLHKNINQIKRADKDLRRMGLKIEVAKDVETMMGSVIDHVYVVDRIGDRISLQKHLLSSEVR